MAALVAAAAFHQVLRRQAAGAPTIIAVSRSSLRTRPARILRRAGVIQRPLAPTLLRQAAAMAVGVTIAPRAVTAVVVALALHAVTVEAVTALRVVMAAEADRAVTVAEATAAALTPAEVLAEAEATRAVEEAVTLVVVGEARMAVVADIRIANLRF